MHYYIKTKNSKSSKKKNTNKLKIFLADLLDFFNRLYNTKL